MRSSGMSVANFNIKKQVDTEFQFNQMIAQQRDDIHDFFAKQANLRFLTIQPYKHSRAYAKFQNISKVSDWLRRYFSSWYIVREKNKSGDNHYHVLGVIKKIGGKAVVIKSPNFRLDLQTVGEKRVCQNYTENGEIAFGKPKEKPHISVEKNTMAQIIADAVSVACRAIAENAVYHQKKEKRKIVKNKHVENILNYMHKENPIKKYHDFIFRS